ncbi:hypothetical protein FRC12_025174 [Ceratobasidium sp. 428]|nr:hypothetical protein FRC12_025174 [Ceratobasidium sp. 428]
MELGLSSLSRYLTPKHIFYTLLGLAVVKLRGVLYWAVHAWGTPLRHLDGPKNDNFIFGHFLKLLNEQSSDMYEKWAEKHGKTFRYRGLIGTYQLYTMDMRAVNFIMSQPSVFDKGEVQRRSVARILGEGLLAADPDAHKRQVSPADTESVVWSPSDSELTSCLLGKIEPASGHLVGYTR